MKSPEGKLQVEVVQWLQANGYYFFSVPNEAFGLSAVSQMQLMSMGLRPGVADLVVLVPPGVVFLELKSLTGKQSDAQKKFEKRVKELGYQYIIVKKINDVSAIL